MRKRRTCNTVIFVFLLVATVCGVEATIMQTLISPQLDENKQVKPAVGMFLVAQRSLSGSYFQRSVVYLVEHGEHGTLGLIVNRPSSMSLSDGVANIDEKTGHNYPLFFGGPVERRQMLMLLRNPPDLPNIEHVIDSIYVSLARDVLEHLLKIGKPSSELRLYIGHSGWAPGQLDFELANKRWHLVQANTESIFSSDIESLWERLIYELEPTGIHVEVIKTEIWKHISDYFS